MRLLNLLLFTLFAQSAYAAELSGRLHLEFAASLERLSLTTAASETTRDVSSDLLLLGTNASALYIVNPKIALKLSAFTSIEPDTKINYSGGGLGIRWFIKDSYQRRLNQEPEIEIKKIPHSGSFLDFGFVKNSLSADIVNISFLGVEAGYGYFWSINENYYLISTANLAMLSGDKNRTLMGLKGQLGIGTFFY
jgi:hypothetical protein